ncbi:hypothetical protein E2C01_102870 [Portunus trituberculatus]|uniref:Uncharacterized protein n=1 Tax=Portunus trituberculatus TaxID=210409 RepID=A0A5B7KNS6_PORTR|nr:hypothetical protein [Portunus trituberculatus]
MTRGKRVRNEGSSRDEFILITRERCPRYPQEAGVSTTQENGSSLRLSQFASLPTTEEKLKRSAGHKSENRTLKI